MPWYCVRSLDRDKLAASPESHLSTGCSSHTFHPLHWLLWSHLCTAPVLNLWRLALVLCSALLCSPVLCRALHSERCSTTSHRIAGPICRNQQHRSGSTQRECLCVAAGIRASSQGWGTPELIFHLSLLSISFEIFFFSGIDVVIYDCTRKEHIPSFYFILNWVKNDAWCVMYLFIVLVCSWLTSFHVESPSWEMPSEAGKDGMRMQLRKKQFKFKSCFLSLLCNRSNDLLPLVNLVHCCHDIHLWITLPPLLYQ